MCFLSLTGGRQEYHLWKEHYIQAFKKGSPKSSKSKRKKFSLQENVNDAGNMSSGRNINTYDGASLLDMKRDTTQLFPQEEQLRERGDELNMKNLNSESISKQKSCNRRQKGAPVTAINLKTGIKMMRYSSQTKAAVTLDIPVHQISLCCRGFKDDAGGFGWQYASGKISGNQFTDISLVINLLHMAIKNL